MKKTHKVVILPTTEASSLYKAGNKLYYDAKSTFPASLNGAPVNQHLYIVSDEEIKEKDWFLNTYDEEKAVYKSDKYSEDILSSNYKGKNYKVIATTDKSLTTRVERSLDAIDPSQLIRSGIELIPQSFVKAYAEQGDIDEVQLEYYDKDHNFQDKGIYDTFFKNKLKLRDDNTVIIHQTITYSAQDIEKILAESLEELTDLVSNDVEYRGCSHLVEVILSKLK